MDIRTRNHFFNTLSLICAAFLTSQVCHAAEPLTCDLSAYKDVPGRTAVVEDGELKVTWEGEDSREEVRLRFALEDASPIIRELAVRNIDGPWTALLRDVVPEFRVVTGHRRITDQQLAPLRDLGVEITQETVDREKWKAFWDAPLRVGPESFENPRAPVDGIFDQPGLPRAPGEVKRATATYSAQGCTVKVDGIRLLVSFPGVELGPFSGRLQYTIYKGTNLILQEVIGRTKDSSVAYKYDAGLRAATLTPESRIVWRDTAGNWQNYRFGGPVNDAPVPLRTNNRIAIAEVENGAIAVFPPPHNFFWAREITTNLGYSWYQKESESSFGFGIRQAEREDRPHQAGRGPTDFRDNFALYNARPNTWQRMSMFIYPTSLSAEGAFDSTLAFTRGDRFKPLPGYRVMATHVHGYFVRRLSELGTTVDHLPSDFEAVRAAGIDIFAPIDGGAGGKGCCPSADEYVENLSKFYEIARRHSDKDFLVMPSVEITPGELPTLVDYLGGHWDIFFSHPVLFSAGRESDEPVVDNIPNRGEVYRLGSAEDVMLMLHRENAVAFMAHPRSKGSTGYPDAIRNTERFRDERFLGIGFRWGMGLDRSEQRLCEFRCLATLDDMNNWVADAHLAPKYVQAISDLYQQAPGDDVYANNPVNYVKFNGELNPDNWAPITNAMRKGDFFVTSGEVLVPSFSIERTDRKLTIVADVEWTFPLDFVEVVWGDGKVTDRHTVSATDLPAFGHHRFEIPLDADEKKWVRFAAWDTAGNGALVQPVKLASP